MTIFLPHPYPEGLAFPVSPIKSAAGVTAREHHDDLCVGEASHDMIDELREYAIRQAGEALEAAQALAEASHCFHDIAARDEARRYMEALIRGRSQAQVRRMEVERGLA